MSHGRPKAGRGMNWHHAFWEASWYDYNIELEKRFREHPALVLPTRIMAHTDLHNDVFPPPKPSHEQMEQVLARVALWTPRDGRLTGLEVARNEFAAMGDFEIADNLDLQMEYLDGRYRYAA